MKNCALLIAIICLMMSSVSSANMVREIWWNSNVSIDDAVALTESGTPADQAELLSVPFWDGIGDAYVARCSGLLTIPAAGEYTFYVASDDSSQLFIDGEEVAYVDGWTGAQDWAANASQTSAPMELAEGQVVEVSAVMQEGGGGDNLGIAWTGPGIDSITLLPDELTKPIPKAKAEFPTPADGATGVVDVVASWYPAAGDAVYDVYAGTDPNALDLIAEGITETSLAYGSVPTELDVATTYYWRVDVNGEPGDVWSFTTTDGLPIIASTQGAFGPPGSDVQLVCTASAPLGDELTYQWYRDRVEMMGMVLTDVPLPEGTAATLDVTAIDISDEGGYYCKVSDEYGEVTSATVQLDVQVGLIHRYTFNDSPDGVTIPDVVGGADGTLVNNTGAAVVADGQLTLGNDGSQRNNGNGGDANGDYVDLPNGIVSSLTQMTIQAWATYTDDSLAIWSRVFAFGTSNDGENLSNGGSNSGYFCVQPNRNGNLAGAEIHQQGGGANGSIVPGGRAPLHEEVLYTYVQDDAAGRVRFYINGVLQGTMASTGIMQLKDLNDNNCWLGRGMWGDPLFAGSFNEFRMYDTVLSPEEIMVSYLTGPDELPVLADDCGTAIVGDKNGDCVIDIVDAAIAVDQYLRESFEKDQAQQ